MSAAVSMALMGTHCREVSDRVMGSRHDGANEW